MKTIIVIEGKLAEKEETEIKRVESRKRSEKGRNSDPTRAYLV